MALDAKSGNHLWHFNTGQLLTASPMTYQVDGKQYVAIAAATDIMVFGCSSRPYRYRKWWNASGSHSHPRYELDGFVE